MKFSFALLVLMCTVMFAAAKANEVEMLYLSEFMQKLGHLVLETRFPIMYIYISEGGCMLFSELAISMLDIKVRVYPCFKSQCVCLF